MRTQERSDRDNAHRRRMRAALGLFAVATWLLASAVPAAATTPAPVVLNAAAQNSDDAQWVETQQLAASNGTRLFAATFLVQHAQNRRITAARADVDYDGVDDTMSATIVNVSVQTLGLAGSLIESSRVRLSLELAAPSGFSCTLIGGAVRSIDVPVRFRLMDDTGELSTAQSSTVKFVEGGNCAGRDDFPRLTSTSQSLVETTPGQSISYTFQCNDIDDDLLSSDDDCDRAQIRWRRLNDGAIGALSDVSGLDDNTNKTITVSFADRGYYVVEARLGNEDGSYPNIDGVTAGWWRLGNAVINASATSLSGSITFPSANLSRPPSVNAGSAVDALLNAADLDGSVQMVEWDAQSDGTFERREYTVPSVSGGDISHPELSSTQLTQAVDTTTPGLVTVAARMTDNGAIDGAEEIRRQRLATGQLRINAIPTAADATTGTLEDTPVEITLSGNDADSQPEPLVYEIVTSPPVSAGTLSALSGNRVTFTPAANFSGSTNFQFRVSDGGLTTVAAHATSNTATVSITVEPVNDAPTVNPGIIVTKVNTSGSVQITGSDPEDGAALTYSVAAQPVKGSAACDAAGLCTYIPPTGFIGSDSFVVQGTDTGSLSAYAVVTVIIEACRGGQPATRPPSGRGCRP